MRNKDEKGRGDCVITRVKTVSTVFKNLVEWLTCYSLKGFLRCNRSRSVRLTLVEELPPC